MPSSLNSAIFPAGAMKIIKINQSFKHSVAVKPPATIQAGKTAHISKSKSYQNPTTTADKLFNSDAIYTSTNS